MMVETPVPSHIDEAELDTAAVVTLDAHSMRRKLYDAFSAADHDLSGVLDFSQFSDGIAALTGGSTVMSEAEMRALWSKFDVDHSGDINYNTLIDGPHFPLLLESLLGPDALQGYKHKPPDYKSSDFYQSSLVTSTDEFVSTEEYFELKDKLLELQTWIDSVGVPAVEQVELLQGELEAVSAEVEKKDDMLDDQAAHLDRVQTALEEENLTLTRTLSNVTSEYSHLKSLHIRQASVNAVLPQIDGDASSPIGPPTLGIHLSEHQAAIIRRVSGRSLAATAGSGSEDELDGFTDDGFASSGQSSPMDLLVHYDDPIPADSPAMIALSKEIERLTDQYDDIMQEYSEATEKSERELEKMRKQLSFKQKQVDNYRSMNRHLDGELGEQKKQLLELRKRLAFAEDELNFHRTHQAAAASERSKTKRGSIVGMASSHAATRAFSVRSGAFTPAPESGVALEGLDSARTSLISSAYATPLVRLESADLYGSSMGVDSERTPSMSPDQFVLAKQSSSSSLTRGRSRSDSGGSMTSESAMIAGVAPDMLVVSWSDHQQSLRAMEEEYSKKLAGLSIKTHLSDLPEDSESELSEPEIEDFLVGVSTKNKFSQKEIAASKKKRSSTKSKKRVIFADSLKTPELEDSDPESPSVTTPGVSAAVVSGVGADDEDLQIILETMNKMDKELNEARKQRDGLLHTVDEMKQKHREEMTEWNSGMEELNETHEREVATLERKMEQMSVERTKMKERKESMEKAKMKAEERLKQARVEIDEVIVDLTGVRQSHEQLALLLGEIEQRSVANEALMDEENGHTLRVSADEIGDSPPDLTTASPSDYGGSDDELSDSEEAEVRQRKRNARNGTGVATVDRGGEPPSCVVCTFSLW